MKRFIGVILLALMAIGCLTMAASADPLDPAVKAALEAKLSQPPLDIGGWLAANVEASLVDHLELVEECTTKGKSLPMLIDSIWQIGRYNNDYVFAIDVGIKDETNPFNGGTSQLGYMTGLHLHAAPIIRKYLAIPNGWTFLNNVEINPRVSYDWTKHSHRPDFGADLAWSFGTQKSPSGN